MSKNFQIISILKDNPAGLTATEIGVQAGIELWRAPSWGQQTLAMLEADGKIQRQTDKDEGITLYRIAEMAGHA